jgi:glycosyltransferase involved in cell wall biosynthesis
MDAGGIETMLMNLYRNIDRDKVQFDFLLHREHKGFYYDEIKELGGRIFSVPRINPFKESHYNKSLDRFFKENNDYKIVHSHNNAYSMYALRAAQKAGIPTRIAHSHTAKIPFLYYRTPIIMYCKFKIKKYTNYNFACSKVAGEWLYGKKATEKDNFFVINNSINSSLFRYNEDIRNNVRREFEISDKFVIGNVGSFTKQKNHSFLIDIFFEIYKKNENSILMLVGDGKLRSSIQKRIKDLGLSDNVIFTGVRTDIPNLLQAMDVFLFPSLYEGLGIVAVEAQGAGLHTIVSEAIPEEAYVTDLIERENLSSPPSKWASKILKYANGYERKDTSEIIKSKGYDIDESAKRLEEFYIEKWKE